MRFLPYIMICSILLAGAVVAEDAAEFREKGIKALKDSQANPRAIVDAARFFAKAEALYADANDEEKAVEMNSFLYWCKKKMTRQDIEQFTNNGESTVTERIEAVERLAPKADEAQRWFERAEQFAQANPNEHLLIAVRFYEVADRFKGSDASLKAQNRSLQEQLEEKSSGAKTATPPVVAHASEAAVATVGGRPVPSTEEQRKAEKLIKDLFKDDYVKTDVPSRLALISKLMHQADENKADAASEYVLLHEARELAATAGDTAQATIAYKRLRDTFKMDFPALLSDLRRLETIAKTAESASTMATLLLLGADDALAVENYDQAVRFNSCAEELLPLIKDSLVKARVKAEIPRVQAYKRDSVPAFVALKTLTTNPDDAEANLAVGKFALERGQFEKAFAMLAKSKDNVLNSLAKRELTPSTEASEQVSLADAWYDRAKKEPSEYLKSRMIERASLWYGSALPGLAGLAKLKVEGQIKSLQQTKTVGSVPEALIPTEIFASGNNGIFITLNGKEILKADREKPSSTSISLKEGDVIAVKLTDRLDINSFWLLCVSSQGGFLFETSESWFCYLPVDKEHWWNITAPETQKLPAKYASNKQEYVDRVKKAAAMAPYDQNCLPIRSSLSTDGHLTYLYYVVSNEDLLPKKQLKRSRH